MLEPAETYAQVYDAFAWRIPERYNIVADVLDRHVLARPEAPALIYDTGADTVTAYSFLDMYRLAGQCANLFKGHGVEPGDRVALLLGQTPETAICHLGAWKIGAITVPLFTLFEEQALAFRLADSGARVVVTDHANYGKILALRDRLPALARVFLIDGLEPDAHDFWIEMEHAADDCPTTSTRADDPALLTYTSGTTGPPKGALHGHRTMLGHMPGFDILHNFYGQPGDLCWSPADWAWLAGLMDVLMPSWWHGKPVLAFRAKGPFDPERAFHVMVKHRVRNVMLVPTMLKLMRQVGDPPDVDLRSVITGGEPVGPEILAWGERQFGFPINEGYGQTECNLVTAHVPNLMPAKPGSLGQAAPGHVAAIVDDDGEERPPGEAGHLAFRRPDPVMMLEYWQNPEATRDKYVGDWLLTGDLATRDEDGYFWFVGRADDVITSAGFRIGPGEIEDCLIKHPAVLMAAAIGVPDPIRTEVIKAFIIPRNAGDAGPDLEADIRDFVRTKLARHAYPRQIEFVDSLPTTVTGKVMRRVLREREGAA